eukprot:g1615.t1
MPRYGQKLDRAHEALVNNLQKYPPSVDEFIPVSDLRHPKEGSWVRLHEGMMSEGHGRLLFEVPPTYSSGSGKRGGGGGRRRSRPTRRSSSSSDKASPSVPVASLSTSVNPYGAGLRRRARCGLCEMEFDTTQLPNSISFKSILVQRRRFARRRRRARRREMGSSRGSDGGSGDVASSAGDEDDDEDEQAEAEEYGGQGGRTGRGTRAWANAELYSTKRICQFCSQFFDLGVRDMLEAEEQHEKNARKQRKAAKVAAQERILAGLKATNKEEEEEEDDDDEGGKRKKKEPPSKVETIVRATAATVSAMDKTKCADSDAASATSDG